MSEGSIRQRSPGSWELKFEAGHDPIIGKRRTKFKTVRGTKRDAQRELRALMKAVDDGAYCDTGKLTLEAYLRDWLAEARHNVSPRTHERYQSICEVHLIPALGTIQLSKLRPIHIQRYYSQALAEGRIDGRGGLSPQTVNHFDRLLHVALKRARQLRLIVTNPVDDVKRPKVERPEPETLDDADLAKLLKKAEGTRLHVPIFLAVATGLRRGELLALRWRDVDLDGQRLSVNQSVEQTKDGLRFKPPKTKQSRRTIALSPSVVEVLQEHKLQQLHERMQLGLGRDTEGLVFTKIEGETINPRNFSKEFSRLVKRAGIRPVTFHGLRHTHITNLLREGVHPKIASERAGHSSVATTLDVYSHAVPGLQEDAALRIDAALRTALEH